MIDNRSEEFKRMQDQWFSTYQSMIDSRVQAASAIFSESFRAIFEYSKVAINGAFLLNGGAGVAVLYNAKFIPGKWETLIFLCALGATFAVLCAGASYVAQRLYYDNDRHNLLSQIQFMFEHKFNAINNEIPNKDSLKFKTPKLAHLFSTIACFFLLFSLGCFAFAILKSLSYANLFVPDLQYVVVKT